MFPNEFRKNFSLSPVIDYTFTPDKPIWDNSYQGHYRGGKTNSKRKPKTHDERVAIKSKRKQSAKARKK